MRDVAKAFPFRSSIALVCTAAALIAAVALPLFGAHQAAEAASSAADERVVVAFVYDDSSSMFKEDFSDDSSYTNAWCQAKYGLETIAAMMDGNDELKVFALNSGVHEVSGSTSAQRAGKVHEDTFCEGGSEYSYTPADALDEAVEWLEDTCTSGAKGYLVVATDGKFETEEGDAKPQEQAEDAIKNCPENIEVLQLMMGKAEPIDGVEEDNAFDASGSDDAIYSQMTKVAERMFGWYPLAQYSDQTGTAKLTLPVSSKRIIVVSQGENASIGTIEGASCREEGAAVTCSEVPEADRLPFDSTVAEAERGRIASKLEEVAAKLQSAVKVFTPEDGGVFAAGSYDLSVQGDEVQVYYEPNVKLCVSLTSPSGVTVISDGSSTMYPGSYTAKFTVYDAGDENDASDDKDVTASLKLSGSKLELAGNGTEQTVEDGGTVDLELGNTYRSRASVEMDGAFVLESASGEITVKESNVCLDEPKLVSGSVSVVDAGNLKYEVTVYGGKTPGNDPLSGAGVVVGVEDSKGYFEWDEPVYDENSGTYSLTMRRVEGFPAVLLHNAIGYRGTATVSVEVDTDKYAGHDAKTFSYELKPDLFSLVVSLVVLLLLLAIILHFIGRGRLGKFGPYFVGPPNGSFESKKSERTPIGEMLLLNRYRLTYRSRSMSNPVLKKSGVTRNLPIELSGVCFSFGTKARFENWAEWKQDGWRITCAKGTRKPIVTAKSALERDSGDVRIKFMDGNGKSKHVGAGNRKARGKRR